MSTRGLPIVHQLPVPWVARWTGEVSGHEELKASLVSDANHEWPLMEYKYGSSERDEYGILWQRDGLNRTGVPQFGQVNTGRQVSCMKYRRCQVCGNKIDGDKTPFMVGSMENRTLIAMKFRTTTPPVCPECAEEATGLCPDLKKGHALLMVTSYEIVAVFGQVYGWSESGKMIQDYGVRDMPLGHPGLRSTYGKQLVVQLHI